MDKRTVSKENNCMFQKAVLLNSLFTGENINIFSGTQRARGGIDGSPHCPPAKLVYKLYADPKIKRKIKKTATILIKLNKTVIPGSQAI